MKNENGRLNNGASQIPAWSLAVPAAEKAVIRDVISSIRGLKSSRSGPVAMAARKWERSIACFIKIRLIGGASRWQVRSRTGIHGQASQQRKMGHTSSGAEPRHGNFPQRGEGGAQGTDRPTASPASLRNQPGASPSQG